MKILRSLLMAISVFFLITAQVRAQNRFTQQTAEIARTINRGNFEEAIAMATEIVNRSAQPDPMALYLRGYAKWSLCYLGDAAADLSLIGDFQPNDKWMPASELTGRIEQLKALCPPHVTEIKDGQNVSYRVYAYEDNAWTKAICAQLPKAFEVGTKMYGIKVYETAVFIFKDAKTYEKFSAARFPKNISASWAWASGSQGIMLFSRTDAFGKSPAEDITGDYFRGTVVHEYSHAILQRRLPGVPIPRWFDEGLAVFAASRIAPGDLKKNDDIMRRCFEQKTLVELKDLTTSATFNPLVEKEEKTRRGRANLYTGTDAYQQSFSMTRYYLLQTKDEDRAQFLEALNETKDFEKSWQQVYGVGLADFFEAWKRDAAKGLPAPPKSL